MVAVCAALADFELDVVRERAALAAVGVREPREARLGALIDAARSLPARRAAAETAESPQIEAQQVEAQQMQLPQAPSPDETGASARRTARRAARVARPRRTVLPPAEPAPEPPPEPARPRRGRRAARSPSPAPSPAPALEPAPAAPRRGRRRVLLAVQILAAAGAAFAALQVGQSGAKTAVVLAHAVSTADVALGVPAGWRRSSSDLAVGPLGLRDAIVLRPGSLGGPMIMAGLSPATGATLLTDALTERVARLPAPARVRLDRMTALRYADLRMEGVTRRMTVFATPTSGGVLTLACLSPPRDVAALRPVCDRVARSLRLTRGRSLALEPSARYQAQLNALVGALDVARTEERAKLASADEASQQAQRAERLAGAYAKARATGVKQRVSPREAAAHARILAAIGATRAAYARMADAARAVSASGYERARAQVRVGDRRVRAALNALTTLGYEIAKPSGSGGS